jgi:hypothetical protein
MRALVAVARVSCLALALCCASGLVRAQSEPEPSAAYRELIDRALAASSAGRWSEARAWFVQAHALYPNARTLRGIGTASFENHDYDDSVRHLRLALLEARRALDPAQRAETEKLLEDALSFVGRYSLSNLPAGSQIVLDGRPVTPEPDGELLVALGQHRIEARAGEQVAQATLTVRGGEREPLPVTFDAPASLSPAAAAAAPTPQAPPADSAYVPHDDTQAGAPFPWTPTLLIVGGGALLIAGTIALVVGLGDVHAVEQAPSGSAWSEVASRNDQAPVMTGLGIGMLTAGAALGTVGTVGLVLADGNADGKTDGVALQVHGWL